MADVTLIDKPLEGQDAPVFEVLKDTPLDLPDKPSKLSDAYRQTLDLQPDMAAQVMKLSKQLGEHPAVIQSNMDAAKRAAGIPPDDYFAALEQQHPVTAAHIADPGVMAAARDDIENMKAMEQHIQDYGFGESMWRRTKKGFYGLMSGLTQAIPGAAQTALTAAENYPLSPIYKMGLPERIPDWFTFEDSARWWDEKAAETKLPDIGPDLWAALKAKDFTKAGRLMAESVAEGAPMLGAVVAGSAMGGSAPMLVGFGALTLGEQQRRGRLANLDPVKSTLNAVAQAGVQTALMEVGTIGPFAKWSEAIAKVYGKDTALKVAGAMTKAIASSYGSMGVLGAGTAISGDLGDYLTGMNPNALSGIVTRAIEAFVTSGPQGVALVGLPAIARGIRRVSLIQQAEQTKKTYLAMGSTEEASKLRKSLPESRQEFIDKVTKGTPTENVYTPAKDFQIYFQEKNIDPVEMAQSLGVEPKVMQDALDTGGNLKIPMTTYIDKIVGTEHWAGLADNVKFNEAALTKNETIRTIQATDQLTIDAAKNAAKEDPVFAAGLDFIYKDVLQKQKESGAFETIKDGQKIMDANATIFAAMAATEARRVAMDPKEYYLKGKAMEIVAGTEAPIGALQQSLQISKPVEDRAVPSISPSDAQVEVVRNAVEMNQPQNIHLHAGERVQHLVNPTGEDINRFYRGTTLYQTAIEKVRTLRDKLVERNRIANITAEAIPSASFNHEINTASPEIRREFTRKAAEILADIPAFYGIRGKQEGIGSGGYAGTINPNIIIGIPLPKKGKSFDFAMADEIAGAYQYIAMQDAVPYFVADPTADLTAKDVSLGRLIRFSNRVTPEVEQALFDALQKVLNKEAGFTRLNAWEIAVVNFRDPSTGKPFLVDDVAFEKAMSELGATYGEKLGFKETSNFGSRGDYGLIHDWKADPEGRSVLQRANPKGSPGIQSGLDRRRTLFENLLYQFSGDILRQREADLVKRNAESLLKLPPPQTETPEFKRWFEKSVVTLDLAPGSPPLVVYHGTKNLFTTFRLNDKDIGIHVGTSTQATDRIMFPTYDFFTEAHNAGKHIKPLYAKIDNPLEMPDLGKWSVERVKAQLMERARSEFPDETDFTRELSDLEPCETMGQLREYIKSRGFDGIRYMNQGESLGGVALFNREFEAAARFIEKFGHPPEQVPLEAERRSPEYLSYAKARDERADMTADIVDYSYIVFDPKQLKSATGNTGAFNPNKPNILLQGTPDDPRGYIQFAPEKTVIGLLKADASTFIHESAHHWIENFNAFIASGQGNAKHLSDWKTLSDWLKIEEGKQISSDQHEQFARGFEAYLREGVSPSEGLRLAFRRFARWLTNLYRDISGLRVELNPDVRGVMDRMLASQEEIDFAHRQIGMDLVPDIPGLDPTVKAKLVALREEAKAQAVEELMTKKMKELSAEKKDELAAATARATEEATKEIADIREYKAMEALQRSKFGLDAKVLSTDFMAGKLSEDKSISFRMIASMLGYTSGQEMATKLLEARSVKDEIAARVADKTAALQPGADKEAIRAQAMEILHNEKQTELLAKEHAIFQSLVDEAQGNAAGAKRRRAEASIEAATAKARAKAIIDGTKIEDAISFMKYFTAERNAALDAQKAAGEGKFQVAADAKQRQLINNALAHEAFRARHQIERWNDYVHKVQMKDVKLFKTEEFFNQVGALLARFGRGRDDFNPALRKETIQQWHDRIAEQGEAVAINPWLLDESVAKPFRELTVSEGHDFINALKNIQRIANAQHNFYRLMAGASVENTVMDLVKEAAQYNTARPAEEIMRRDKTAIEKLKAANEGYDIWIRQIETAVDKLGGWKDDSLWHRIIWKPIEEQAAVESNLWKPVSEGLEKLLTDHFAKQERKDLFDFDKTIFVPELGQSVRKIELLMMALNTGNESNRTRLFDTRIVGMDPALPWGEQPVMDLLQSKLKSNDWRFVQGTWDLIHSLWPQEAANHKELTGFTPEAIDPMPFSAKTADGQVVEMRGGYFPLKVDRRANLIADVREDLETPLYGKQNAAWVAVTKTGHLKARAQGAAYPVDISDSSLIQRHLRDAIHDIAFRGTVIDLNRLTNNQMFSDAMKAYAGPEQYKAFREWVQSIAGGNAKEKTSLEFMDKVLRYTRQNFSTAVLVLNPRIITQNLSNVFLYAKAIEGFGWKDTIAGLWKNGVADFSVSSLLRTQHAEDVRQRVYSLSAFMRDKKHTPDITLKQTVDKLSGGNKSLTETFFNFFSASDELTSIPIWITAYEQGETRGLSESDAILRADTLIRRTVGPARIYETAPMARGNEFGKNVALFQSFMNAQQMRWQREKGLFRQDYFKNAPAFTGYFLAHFVSFAAMSNIMSGNWPDLEDDVKLKRWIKSLALYKFQMLPGIGGLASLAADHVLDIPSYGYKPLPILSVVDRMAQGLAAVGGAIHGTKEPKDVVEALMHTLAYATGKPDQLVQLFWNIYDYWAEGMTPRPGDILRRRPVSER